MRTDSYTEQMIKDLKAVAHDAEELVKATSDEVSTKTREARARLAAALQTAKQAGQRWEEQAVEGAKAADKVVREHPYPTVGAAFLVGLLVGVLISHK